MLILTRRAGEAILLSGGIRVSVIATERGQVRLGIEAPAEVSILRQEIVDDVTAGTVAAVATRDALERLGLGRPVSQPGGRSRKRAADRVGADQKTTPSPSRTAETTSPSTRKEKARSPEAPAARSQAERS